MNKPKIHADWAKFTTKEEILNALAANATAVGSDTRYQKAFRMDLEEAFQQIQWLQYLDSIQ